MKKTGTTFVLLNKLGEILMQKRDKIVGIPYPDTWCIPGGSLEEGENYIDNVIREVKEEYNLGVKREDCQLVTTYNHDDIVDDHVYVCHVGDEKPEMREGSAMKWMTLDDAKKLSLGWEQKKITTRLEDFLRS